MGQKIGVFGREMTVIWSSLRPHASPIAATMTHIFKILALLSALTIAYLSLRPSFSTGGIQHMDKVHHFLAYAVMAGLFRLGWPRLWGGWIVLGVAAIGVTLEIGQHMMALGRTASIADAIANTLGALMAVLIVHLLRRRFST